MMRKLFLGLALFIALIVLSVTGASAQKPVGEPFDLGVGESVLITDAGIRVGFDELVYESRCPINVVCFWEGNAAALVSVETSPANPQHFELNTHSMFRTTAVFQHFLIRLLAVVPYPEDGVIVDPNDYVVTLVVDRMEPLPTETRTWGAIKALFK